MGNALAVAGQAAANQVFNTAFWMGSFLPSGQFTFHIMHLFCQHMRFLHLSHFSI